MRVVVLVSLLALANAGYIATRGSEELNDEDIGWGKEEDNQFGYDAGVPESLAASEQPSAQPFWMVNNGVCPPTAPECKGSGPDNTHGSIADPFFEGDILLNGEQRRMMYEEKQYKEAPEGRRKRHRRRRLRRSLVKSPVVLWPDAIVPFQVDPQLGDKAKSAIKKAMRHISQKTCIRFRSKRSADKDYLFYANEPGCWSEVGRQQGQQNIGVGVGCEHFITMVHETAHALGLWHEQSRPDRDKYVRIRLDRVSSRGKKNFGKLNSTMSISLGYPYDYKSVMHYGERYFTNTGGRTIEVVGLGKKLRVKTLGNQDRLSDLDIAQLRDMYGCNNQFDLGRCPSGWVRKTTNAGTSCYKIMTAPQQFSGAVRMCEKHNAHVLHINTRDELSAVSEMLKRPSKFLSKKKNGGPVIWRLGARRINGTFIWSFGNGKAPDTVKYIDWKKGGQSKYSSIGVEYDDKTQTFDYVGLWLGSQKDFPKNAYPFVCERNLKTAKCTKIRHKNGMDYRGHVDFTESGTLCQRWTENYPHQVNLTSDKKALEKQGIDDHNYCRNPFGKKDKPWCYTTKDKVEWEYCNIRLSDSNCDVEDMTSSQPRVQVSSVAAIITLLFTLHIIRR